MKQIRAITALAIISAVISAAAYYQLSYSLGDIANPGEYVQRAIDVFRQTTVSDAALDVSQLSIAQSSESLNDPDEVQPQSIKYDRRPLAAVYLYAHTCSNGLTPKAGGNLQKTWTWHRWICGVERSLPLDFF